MRLTRRARIATVLLACGLAAAGCGSSTKTKTVTAPAATAPATATQPTGTATSSAGSSTGKATTPGTVLEIGQQGRIVYDAFDPKTKQTHPQLVGATLLSVQQGKLSDLQGFDLDAQTKISVPFYVKVTFANLSKLPLKDAGLPGLMNILDADGDEAQSLGLIGDFPKCEGSTPRNFAPGAKADTCDVYVLPKGKRVTKVKFSSGATAGVSWNVG
jgi:hypothetical protein